MPGGFVVGGFIGTGGCAGPPGTRVGGMMDGGLICGGLLVGGIVPGGVTPGGLGLAGGLPAGCAIPLMAAAPNSNPDRVVAMYLMTGLLLRDRDDARRDTGVAPQARHAAGSGEFVAEREVRCQRQGGMLVACPGAMVRGCGGVWVVPPGGGMGELPGGQWVVPWGGMLLLGMVELGMVELGAVEFGMALGLVGAVLGAAVAVMAAMPSSNPDRVVHRYFMTSSPCMRWIRL